MIDKLDAAFRFEQQAVSLRAQRQAVLASNIANASTPGYKARDFDFGAQLRRATDGGGSSGDGALTLATTSALHIQGGSAQTSEADLLYRVPAQSSIDGNTVEMDAERANFAENTVHFQSGLAVISSKMKQLLAALQQ